MFFRVEKFSVSFKRRKAMKNIAQEVLLVLVITVSCVSAALLIA